MAVCGACADTKVENERLCFRDCVSRPEPFQRDAEANVLVANVLVVAKLPAIDQQSRSRIRLVTYLEVQTAVEEKVSCRPFWQCHQINLSRCVDVKSREQIRRVEVERECAKVHVRDVREPGMLLPYRVFPDITRVPHLRVITCIWDWRGNGKRCSPAKRRRSTGSRPTFAEQRCLARDKVSSQNNRAQALGTRQKPPVRELSRLAPTLRWLPSFAQAPQPIDAAPSGAPDARCLCTRARA